MVIKKIAENKEIIDDDTNVAEDLNNFLKIVDIHRNHYTVENVENISEPVDKAIKKSEFRPLILF